MTFIHNSNRVSVIAANQSGAPCPLPLASAFHDFAQALSKVTSAVANLSFPQVRASKHMVHMYTGAYILAKYGQPGWGNE